MRRRTRIAPELQIAFPAQDEPGSDSAIAVHVNFGVVAGREATSAEIDRLAAVLLDRVGHVTVVSEQRHEIDSHSEAAVHQVRIEVPPAAGDRRVMERWVIDKAERWARRCTEDPTLKSSIGTERV